MTLTIKVPANKQYYVFGKRVLSQKELSDLIEEAKGKNIVSIPIELLYKSPETLIFNLSNEPERIQAIKALQNLYTHEVFTNSEMTKTGITSEIGPRSAEHVIQKMSDAGIAFLEFVK